MTDAFLDSTLVTALVAGLLILLRRPMLAAFGPEWTYAAWLLPVLPAIPLRMPALPSMDPGGVLSGSAGAVYAVTADFEQQVAPAMDLAQLALWIWALGAVALFAWGVSRYAYLLQLLRDAETVDRYDDMPVQIASVPVPMTVGVFTLRIIVPASLWATMDAAGRSKILAHEGVHARRRDVLWNLIGFGLLCLHWLNPVAWLAYRSMRRDQELSCDARVTGSSSPGDRARYARLLVEVVAAQPVSPAPAMAADLARIEERIKMIWRHTARPAVTRTALIALVAAGAAMSGLRAGAVDAVSSSDDDQLHREGPTVTVDVRVVPNEEMNFTGADGHTVTVNVRAMADDIAREGDGSADVWFSEDGGQLHEVQVDDSGNYRFATAEDEEQLQGLLQRVAEHMGDTNFQEGVRLEVAIERGGMSTQPSMVIPYGADGVIELRGEVSQADPISLVLNVAQASSGTAVLDWSVREQYAEQWVDIASGTQHVTLGERTELVTGLAGTTIILTASDNTPHED